MKILYVAHDYLPEGVHGTCLSTHSLARQMIKRGHTVAVFCGGRDEETQKMRTEEYEYEGIRVRRVYRNPHKNFIETFKVEKIDDAYMEFQEEFQPDVVHVQHLIFLSASILERIQRSSKPSVVTLRDFWFMCRRYTLLRPSGKLCSGSMKGLNCIEECMGDRNYGDEDGELRKMNVIRDLVLVQTRNEFCLQMLGSADVVTSPSRHLKERFISEGFNHQNFRVIPNGFNADRYIGIKRKTSPTLRFFYMGGIVRHKGVDVMLKAFRKLANDADISLDIAGDTESDPLFFNELEAIIGFDHRIKFIGVIPNNEMPKKLSGVDVVVVPSVWYENSPRSINEALAAGLPVIASDIGGMKELLSDGVNGFLFKVGDSDDLSEKMRVLIEKRELLSQLARTNKVRTEEETADEFENIYSMLIDEVS